MDGADAKTDGMVIRASIGTSSWSYEATEAFEGAGEVN